MNLRASLSKFIPRILFPLIKDRKDFCVLKGCVLFADLAGFTNLTENLTSIGKEGAEELTKILNSFFERMIDIILESGGDVVRFGGDAMTIFFPFSAEKALKTSLILQKECLNFQNVHTKAGNFSLGMKIGVSYGDVTLGIVGNKETGFDYFASGDALDRSAEAEHHAQKGEVLVHPECSSLIDETRFNLIKTKDGFLKVESEKIPSETENKFLFDDAFIPEEDQLLDFLPAYVKEKAEIEEQKLVGEHRRTTTLFLRFSNLDCSKLENINKIKTIYSEIASSVKKFGGIINKIDMGDKGSKILALFGSPLSLENQEEFGVRCSLEIIENKVLQQLDCDLSIGMTTSNLFSAYVGSNKRREFTVMGDGINLAARLMTANLPSKIIVNEAVYQKTKDLFEYKSYEPISVKGKSEKIKVFAPLNIKESIQKIGSFIGREKETNEVLDSLNKSDSEPFISVIAPSGMGKSDFLLKIKEIVDEKGCETIYTKLAPYDKEKFFTPLKNVISHCINLELRDGEQAKEVIQKSLLERDQNYLPLFNDLFKLQIEENSYTKPLTSKERKEIFFAIVSRILLNSLTQNQHYIFIDHIDYADPSTIEFLLFFSEDLRETKSRILFTLREENLEIFNELLEKSYIIKLPPFSKSDIESYLVQREGFASPAEFLLDFLLNKSGGNPKFLSELVSIMKAQKLAFIGPSGKYEVDEDKLSSTTFPDSLQALFLSKVEGLREADKSILRAASVLGTSFSIETLSSLTEKPPEFLVSKINELEPTSLIKMDTWGVRPYASFSDNLLREAVYNSLNFELRRELHLKVAKFLEGEGAISPRALPVLARHYENGGDNEKALHYLFESAKYSKSIYDYRSSFEYLSRYVAIAEKNCLSLSNNSQFLDAFLMLAEVQQELGRIREAGICFEKIIAEIKELSPIKVKSLSKLADNKRREGNLKESLELYEKALVGAKELKDESLQCLIFLYSGVPLAMSGKMGKAMDYFQRAEILAEKLKDYPSLVYALMNRGLVEYFRGKLEGAKSFLLKAKDIAAESNLKSYLALITVNLSQVFFESGEYIKALEICKEAEDVSRQFGYRNHLVMSMSNRALYETMLGLWEEAEKSVEKALTSAQHYNMSYLIATNFHIKSLLFFVNGSFSKSFEYQILAFENYLKTNYFGEAVGSLSELISLTNQLGRQDLAIPLLEENLRKLQKELENSSRTWTISFNAHYSYHKFLTGDVDYYDTEEKLENFLEKARETGILWLVAEVGSVFLKFLQLNHKTDKAVEIGLDLFPLLSIHYCPLILPKFLIPFCKSLLEQNQKDDLSSALNCLHQYENFLDRGLLGIEYSYLLYKIFENDNKDEAQKRLLLARTIAKDLEEKEKNELFKNSLLNLALIKEVNEN